MRSRRQCTRVGGEGDAMFINRMLMNLFERDRARRADGNRFMRANSAIAGTRSAWAAVAEANDFAFDEEPEPQIRGLLGPAPFELFAAFDREGNPFSSLLVHAPAPSTRRLVIGVPDWVDRTVRRGSIVRTGDADFDKAFFVRGDPALVRERLGETERNTLLALHYRSPWLSWDADLFRAELDGVELDVDLLGRFIEFARAITRNATAVDAAS